ncbi:MAG: MerR family transcriptional regulator [Oscillospiraceae bacterium]
MDLQKLTVGQMAKLNHVTEQTLRLYDREALLRPARTDACTGYRYYHINQSARLDLIQALKTYGMTLRQIKELFFEENPNAIKELLGAQMTAVDSKLKELARAKSAIGRALENYQKYEALPKNGEIFFEYIAERKIYKYECVNNFFEQDDTGYEYMLRELKQHLVLNEIPMSYFCNLGTIIRKEHLIRGELFSNEVFMFVDEESDSPAVELVPSATFLCLCSDDFAGEAQHARRLLAELDRLSYTVDGSYLCEVIIDYPVLEFDKRNMFYKIQIPVKAKGTVKSP